MECHPVMVSHGWRVSRRMVYRIGLPGWFRSYMARAFPLLQYLETSARPGASAALLFREGSINGPNLTFQVTSIVSCLPGLPAIV